MDSNGHILMRDHCTKYYIFHDHLFLCMQIVLIIKSYIYYFSLGSDSGLTDRTFDLCATSLFFFLIKV